VTRKKTGIIVFTHGSRRKAGNEVMLQLVEQIRKRTAYRFAQAYGRRQRITSLERLIGAPVASLA